jgi:hypothetical protein
MERYLFMELTPNSDDMERFLKGLCQESQRETDRQFSMYTIGEQLGFDREYAGRMGEEIIAQGWAEIRTLAGDIGITTAGLEYLDSVMGKGDDQTPRLGSQFLMDDSSLTYLEGLIAELKVALGQSRLDYDTLAEIVADLKSLEAQFVSPRIKTGIVRLILEDIVACLSGKYSGQAFSCLKAFLT